MNPTEPEDLLWEISRRDEPAEGPPPPDEALQAYREGRLPEEEALRMEALLAASPAARARLAELAGVAAPAPPAAVRSRVLARFPGRPSRSPVRRWLPAAALAASLVLAIGYSVWNTPSLPAGLSYEVTAAGIARDRSAGKTAEALEAFPGTRVRLVVEPRGEALADVGFGVYRERGRRLERLATSGGGLSLEVRRGAAVLTAPASALVGDRPGTYDLYLVVARPGDLPAGYDVTTETDREALLEDDGRRLAYPVRLTLLAPPPSES
jgi:hypothetical protein